MNQTSKSATQKKSQNLSIPPNNSKSKISKIGIILGILGVAIITCLVIYLSLPKSQQETIKQFVEDVYEDVYKTTVASASRFATYEEVAVNIDPKVPTYSVAEDLSNIINIDDFYFSNEAKNLLVKNAFVVNPAYYNEFFSLYESNRYSYIPNFITTDSMLHNYHLMFDFLLKQLEEQKLTTELKQLNTIMLSEAINQFNSLKGTEWENASKRNVAFFAVGSKLLDDSINIPSFVVDEVNQELTLIEEHAGLEMSPIMDIIEDYSQYIPRGHYDQSEQLKAYFKSMMWYGRLTFRMKKDDEVKSALLITLALNKNNNQEIWNNIYEPVNFFVGKSDDITYYEFRDLLEQVYGLNTTLELVLNDTDKFNSFITATKELRPPQINSMPIFEASIQSDREEEITGFRFMGQRFTVDASIFQRLIYREVGDKTKSCQEFDPMETGCRDGARCLPKGLDIPASLGSSEAKNILDEMGETQYACYSENMSKLNNHLSELSTDTWTQNLYWGWLYQLLPLLDKKGSGYPVFMQSNDWTRKDLNTFLGSWAELKHDTILYAKQVYAELGAGGVEEKDDRGYVEPNPYVYARLASLLKMTIEGLEVRDFLTPSMKENLSIMEDLAMSLKIISEKELNNEKLTEDEFELICSFGGQLEHLWLEINKDEPAFKEMLYLREYLNENPAAIISDVATDPDAQVALEEGTGKIFEIFVVVPIDGKLKIAKGGVYSYYEFIWPISDRLTDKKWRELLNNNEAPALPVWTDSFITK